MLVTFSLHVSNLRTASPKVSNLMSVLFVYRYSLFLVIDIYITWIWVYMKSLSSWSGGGDEKKKVHRSLRHTSFYNSWSWRESNPRPNEETISFLHAYLCLRFSSASKTRATNSRKPRGGAFAIPDFAVPFCQTLRNKSFWTTSRFRYFSGNKGNLLYFDHAARA